MSFRKQSARRARVAALTLVLAAPAASFAAVRTEAPGELVGAVGTSRPSTDLPASPLPLPAIAPIRFTTGHGLFPAVHPLSDRETLSFAPVFGPDAAAAFRSESFSVRLLSRMSHEALRYRERNVSDAGGAFRSDSFGEIDAASEATRSAAASRVISRSSHRALGDELDRVARAAPGLGAALDLLQDLSLRRARTGASDGESSSPRQGPHGPGPRDVSPRPRGDVGVRLDAHPALLFRARFGTLSARIDLPVRNEPVRLTLESPLGHRGRAVLCSGLQRDGQGWGTLTFSFGF